jgi:hypothetical protein
VIVTSAPAGTLRLLRSKAMFLATRSIVTLLPDVALDVVVRVEVDVEDVVEAVDEHEVSARTRIINMPVKSKILY